MIRKIKCILFFILVILIAILVCYYSNRSRKIMDYVVQDQSGFFYDQSNEMLFKDRKPDFYTTLLINRLKNEVSGKVTNASMQDIDGYDLHNFTCIKQLTESNYVFTSEEKQEIKLYLQSLQEPSQDYLIYMDQDSVEENNLFFTYEALKITRTLNIQLTNIERIKEHLLGKTLDNCSCKETMSILGMDSLLQTELFTRDEIQTAYTKLFENWYNSDSSQISWFFDLYYLSYIAKIGQVSDVGISSTFKEDLMNLIENKEMNLTLKCMAVDILNNYMLFDEEVVEVLKEMFTQVAGQCALGKNQYAYLNIYSGNIATTYYVYLNSKLEDRKLHKTQHLRDSLEQKLSENDLREYSFQELYQLLFLSKEYNLIDTGKAAQLTLYLMDCIEETSSISEIYFLLQSVELLNGRIDTLQDKQLNHIEKLLQELLDSKVMETNDIYTKMFHVFFYTSIETLLYNNGITIQEIPIESYLSEAKKYLDRDIRILYFYYFTHKQRNPNFTIAESIINGYRKQGLYKLNTQSKVISAYVYYLGKMMESFNSKDFIEGPII